MPKWFRRSGWLATVGAVAAGLCLWVLTGLLVPVSNQQRLPQVKTSLNQTQNVNLTVNVEHAMDEVMFSIRMQKGVDMAGLPGKRIVRWEGSLHPGKNLLSLPLIAYQRPNGELQARISYQGKSKVYKVKLALRMQAI